MNKIRKIVSILLVVSMILQTAPAIICKAAENVYELVINPETPLDEVYFYSNETEDKKGYYYGFLDGKVSVMDEDYNLIKKTEFDMINSTKLVNVKGKPAFVASKKIDGKNFYGIVSFDGETIVDPEYSWIIINSEKSRITIEKEIDNQDFSGLWNLNCEEILPLEYHSIDICDEKDNKLLIVARNKENKRGIILDNQMIWEEKEIDSNHYYSYKFCEYENEKCIKVVLYDDTAESYENDRITLLKYDGSIIKEFSGEEWNKYERERTEKKYKEVCEEWLNKESENGKNHVIDFFKEKGITLSETKTYTGFDINNNIFYYWVIVTAEYPKSEKYKNDKNNFDTNLLTYTFIYNDNKECIISGRSFGKIDIGSNGRIYSYASDIYRHLLSDNGIMRYFHINTGKVEDLFKIDEDILTYVSDCKRIDYSDDADNEIYDDEIHKLWFKNKYKFDEIIEHIDNGDSKSYKYVYIDYKRYPCADYTDNYCFIENDINGIDIFFWNENNKWELYKHENISASEIMQYDKICRSNNLCLNDTTGEKIIIIGKNKNCQITYNELGVTGKVSINDIVGDGNKKLVILDVNGINKYFDFDLGSGSYEKIDIDPDTDKLLQDMNLINLIETNGKLYTYTERNVVVIDKKTFGVDIILPYENFGKEITINNRETFQEFIESLVILNNEVYIKYKKEYRKYKADIDSDSNSSSITNFYGIMNLKGEKKIQEIEDNSGSTECTIVANYIFAKNDDVSNVYDSSFNLVATNIDYFEKGDLVVMKPNDESSDFIPKLINKNTGKEIYDFVNEKIKYYIYPDDVEILGKYYLLRFSNNNYEKKYIIIDISSGKPVFYGKAFIHEKGNKIVVFGESEEIVYPTEEPTISPSTAPAITVSPLPSNQPTQKPSGGSSGEYIPGPSAIVPNETPSTLPSQMPSPSPDATVTPAPVQTPVTTPEATVKPDVTATPEITVTPQATATPVRTPEPETTPTQTPEATLIPSASTDYNNSSPVKLGKGSNVKDKKTKAVYKVTGTGKNKIVQYEGSTKKNAANVVIPASVKLKGETFKVVSVGNGVFKNNKKLKSVKIGKNIKTIGKEAFSGCKKLADVKMGKNITSIKANAFSKCKSLTVITIPSNVKNIGKKAFYQCKNLKYIDIKTKKLKPGGIGSNAFGNGYSSPRIKTNKSVWKKYQNVLTSKGLSNKAVFITNPVKLIL